MTYGQWKAVFAKPSRPRPSFPSAIFPSLAVLRFAEEKGLKIARTWM
jgi:hypothetical protein